MVIKISTLKTNILAGRIANILNYVHFNVLNGLDYDKDHLNKVRCNIIEIDFTFTSLEDTYGKMSIKPKSNVSVAKLTLYFIVKKLPPIC